ncbi:CtsR family transcriptional regulator, partial [Prauserella flavalba]|uniref:CtsR family transcriptional regulator n=1 Tax=Prauserella flavalba TaxID=1477506 RepID=UPI0036E19EBB
MRNVTICLFAKAGFMLVQSGNNRDRAIQLKNFAKHLIVRLKSNIVKVNGGGGGVAQNISDIIEQYLKEVLDQNGREILEIKRNEIADK